MLAVLVNHSRAVAAGRSEGNVSCTGYGGGRIVSTALASLQVGRYCVPERRLAGSVGGQVECGSRCVTAGEFLSVGSFFLAYSMCYAKLIIIGGERKRRAVVAGAR